MLDQQRSEVCYFAVRYYLFHQSWQYDYVFSTQAISIILDMCVIDALGRLYYSIANKSFSMKSWLFETKFTITLLSHSKSSTTSLSLTISILKCSDRPFPLQHVDLHAQSL